METEIVLLFDGVCNLCNGVVRFIIPLEPAGKIKFAPLQSNSGQKILKKFGLPQKKIETFVLIKNNRFYIKSSAVLEILKSLNFFWPLGYLFKGIPRFIRDGVYDLVAKYRLKIFGSREACMVPTPDLKNRFIE